MEVLLRLWLLPLPMAPEMASPIRRRAGALGGYVAGPPPQQFYFFKTQNCKNRLWEKVHLARPVISGFEGSTIEKLFFCSRIVDQ
jgi:hypothetical protein